MNNNSLIALEVGRQLENFILKTFHMKDSMFTKVGKKAKIRNRCNQLPHLTQDTEWESDKNTRKHCTQDTQEAFFLTSVYLA